MPKQMYKVTKNKLVTCIPIQKHHNYSKARYVFLAYETRISASTSGAGKCHLTPPCKTSRVR